MSRGRLWGHGRGIIRDHGEVDPTGETVLGLVSEVGVWALKGDRGAT